MTVFCSCPPCGGMFCLLLTWIGLHLFSYSCGIAAVCCWERCLRKLFTELLVNPSLPVLRHGHLCKLLFHILCVGIIMCPSLYFPIPASPQISPIPEHSNETPCNAQGVMWTEISLEGLSRAWCVGCFSYCSKLHEVFLLGPVHMEGAVFTFLDLCGAIFCTSFPGISVCHRLIVSRIWGSLGCIFPVTPLPECPQHTHTPPHCSLYTGHTGVKALMQVVCVFN